MTDRLHPKHRAFIRSLFCVRCGRTKPECAHVRLSTFEGAVVPVDERGGTGLKPHDAQSVPLCSHCHRIQHDKGEYTFWHQTGINPIQLAKALWRNTGNESAAKGILARAQMGIGL